MPVGRLAKLAVAALAAVFVVSGCQNDGKSRKKSSSAKGFVTKTDLANNKVSMKVKKERDGSEVEITGSLAPETEVFINGLKRTPADVELNDEIRVEYEKTGDGVEMQFTVLRVDVTRPVGWKSTRTEPEIKIVPPIPEGPTKADRTFIAPPTAATTPPTAAPATPQPGAANQPKAEEMTNQIYAEIRKRLDEAVVQRADLLKQGKPANDPEVQHREGIIRKARSLLMERGENVEPIVPPLPEDIAPATTQPAAGS